jgi:hypothetical protein
VAVPREGWKYEKAKGGWQSLGEQGERLGQAV